MLCQSPKIRFLDLACLLIFFIYLRDKVESYFLSFEFDCEKNILSFAF